MKDNINISEKDGQILVKTARMVVTDYLKNGSKTELGKKFQEVFIKVTHDGYRVFHQTINFIQ